MNLNRLKFIPVLLLLSGLMAPAPAIAAPGPMTYGQLRNLVMDFADKYMQMLGQAADTLQKKSGDPETRSGTHSLKLFPCSAAFSIAMDSNPHRALLDMVVLVHLQGDVWGTSLPERYHENAPAFMAVQRTLEDDVDQLALLVMTPEKLNELKALIEEWRKKHPDQRYVSYIRLANFEELANGDDRPGRGPSLSIGTLLSVFQLVNIDEASQSMDSVRATAETAIYLAERMPTLIRWQSQMLFYELAASPESKNLLSTSQSLHETMDKLPVIGHRLIWEAVLGLIVVAMVVFFLAVLYRIIFKSR